jgi:hypothetical protein
LIAVLVLGEDCPLGEERDDAVDRCGAAGGPILARKQSPNKIALAVGSLT